MMTNFAPERRASSGMSAAGVTTKLDPTTKKRSLFRECSKESFRSFSGRDCPKLITLKTNFLWEVYLKDYCGPIFKIILSRHYKRYSMKDHSLLVIMGSACFPCITRVPGLTSCVSHTLPPIIDPFPMRTRPKIVVPE